MRIVPSHRSIGAKYQKLETIYFERFHSGFHFSVVRFRTQVRTLFAARVKLWKLCVFEVCVLFLVTSDNLSFALLFRVINFSFC